MAYNEAYLEAERKIERAKRSGATELDLSSKLSTPFSEKLSELPQSLSSLTHLQRLTLDNNILAKLPEWFNKLNHLELLSLENNRLTQLPELFIQFSRLRYLYLSNNAFTELPEWFKQLRRLRALSLSNNKLTGLPQWLGQFNRLRALSLDGQLTELPEWLGQLKDLEFLSLENNQLGGLPDWFRQLNQLKSLTLEGNMLTDLPEWLGELNRLESLYLGHNLLERLPESLGMLNQLQWLSIHNNELTKLPDSLVQLTQLETVYFFENDISELPISLGRLPKLETILLHNNPLPSEILRLEEEGRLIAYLRELADNGGVPDYHRTFDEAKLLLIGPGEVGKTWLLQALQGNIPQSGNSTKGLEIARIPLEISHPTQEERTLHLNCWDFGGQDHYQVTHQIFFSPKAIYLLVWKPRPGFDPDLEARLERIQLSAGQTAKVFIVSTYADDNVPAVLGEDALRERFPDLIQGFYAVDSAKGSEGTGIANLLHEIAKAAANLEGMDTPFPANWHEAQKAIRALEQPTLSFREFAKICIAKGMKDQSCEALASIMDVQGNAVFFDDAPQSGEAGVIQDDNLVVLDPEWLAKAVTFVLEDEETRSSSGVLVHNRLQKIWRADKHRDCPGYDSQLFGFLLWMMWKFDIAYKQNEQTSLVPELIHRNRPDDLRWTPIDQPHDERQATLICRIPQDPPVGLIPALTAAVQPWRRIQNPDGVVDQLDRNWRDGFFLDSELRGTAFVELIDRDLQIVVRDRYPKDLCGHIRKTLNRIKSDRWPRLDIDYRVPCVSCSSANKPKKGTFKWEYLDQRRGKQVSCQDCNNDEVEVDLMLEGFDAHS